MRRCRSRESASSRSCLRSRRRRIASVRATHERRSSGPRASQGMTCSCSCQRRPCPARSGAYPPRGTPAPHARPTQSSLRMPRRTTTGGGAGHALRPLLAQRNAPVHLRGHTRSLQVLPQGRALHHLHALEGISLRRQRCVQWRAQPARHRHRDLSPAPPRPTHPPRPHLRSQ